MRYTVLNDGGLTWWCPVKYPTGCPRSLGEQGIAGMSRPRGPRTTYVDDNVYNGGDSVFSYHGGSHWALQIARDCREYEHDMALRDSMRATKLARLCGYLGIIAVTIAMVVGSLATY